MVRSLRVLERVFAIERSTRAPGNGLFWCAVTSIVLQFFLTSNVLRVVTGEDINMRAHPANILIMLCAFYALATGVIPLHQRCRESPGLILFVCAIPLFGIYTLYFNGLSGTAFYFDSFWGPGLLAVVLESSSAEQRRLLARILLWLVVLNVLFALYESVTQYNVFPFVANDTVKEAQIMATDDFRANAFYPHPLTASLITSMAMFMVYAMRLKLVIMAPIFLLLFVGLLAFGGRTALFLTAGLSVLAAAWVMLRGIIKRDLKLEVMFSLIAAAIVVPLVIAFIVTQTTIAERIVDTLYYDDSAEVRVTQWMVLNYLSLRNWLFGVPMMELEALKYQIGLGAVEDIENFWLLLFLNLGSIGFVVFLLVFGAFLVYIARKGGGMYAWMLMISSLIIDSGSNSLGRRSDDLFIEVAFLFGVAGYRDFVREPIRRMMFRPIPARNVEMGLAPFGAAPPPPRGLRPSPRA